MLVSGGQMVGVLSVVKGRCFFAFCVLMEDTWV